MAGEVSSPPGGSLLSKDLEGMYEAPLPPLPVATPTSGNVGRAGEDDEAVYELIPGDK